MNIQFTDIKEHATKRGLRLTPDRRSASYLAHYDLQVEVIFDVGVNTGTPFLYEAFPTSKFVLVDPLPDCDKTVRESGLLSDFDFVNTALGAQASKAILEVPIIGGERKTALSSLKKRTDPLSEQFERVERRQVEVRTLDDVASNYSGRVGIKIDTEGHEVEILEGARDTLHRCEFVILELSLTQRFKDVSRPSRAVSLMADAGLELRDFIDMQDRSPDNKLDRRPRHADLLFTRWGDE